jgi:hypothetical protein
MQFRNKFFFEFNFGMPQHQMLDDLKKIIDRHNGRRVVLCVDGLVGGSRTTGTAAMVIEKKKLRFDKTQVLNSIRYVNDCLLLLINKLQLEPLVVVCDQDAKYEKLLNALEKPRFLVENFVVWAYRDPYHLFFTFERGFQKIKNLGPSIFNTEIFYYNQKYNFNNRIIAENRDIFKHMEQIPNPEKRKLMKIIANFFDVSFQKTLLVDTPFLPTVLKR